MNIKDVKFDCRYFKSSIPCKPNKQNNKECDSCNVYTPAEKRILIIKLGSIGDVIRSTPLVVRYRELYPNCHITWLTLFPDVLPKDNTIDEIYKFNFSSIYSISHQKFDIAINLDKEIEVCSLLADVQSTEKYGYIWDKAGNHIAPATPAAEQKLLTGFFDNISKKNTKHYLDEIFEICHLKFNDEPYLLNFNKDLIKKFTYIKDKANSKKIIGLNTGCGERWKTRLWQKESWEQLSKLLLINDFFPILLGGEAENIQNLEIAKNSDTFYAGHFSLEDFIALTSICDGIVTQVSMMMHIATALQKPMVLMNNIFNPNEFYLYDRGILIEPSTGCDCFYGNTCSRQRHCMLDISPQTIFDAIIKLNYNI